MAFRKVSDTMSTVLHLSAKPSLMDILMCKL